MAVGSQLQTYMEWWKPGQAARACVISMLNGSCRDLGCQHALTRLLDLVRRMAVETNDQG